MALDLPCVAGLSSVMSKVEPLIVEAGGRFYAAKDAFASPGAIRQGYPALDEFMTHVDPKFSSSLWRRWMPEERGVAV